jgi:hypothetical protein
VAGGRWRDGCGAEQGRFVVTGLRLMAAIIPGVPVACRGDDDERCQSGFSSSGDRVIS